MDQIFLMDSKGINKYKVQLKQLNSSRNSLKSKKKVSFADQKGKFGISNQKGFISNFSILSEDMNFNGFGLKLDRIGNLFTRLI